MVPCSRTYKWDIDIGWNFENQNAENELGIWKIDFWQKFEKNRVA